MKEFIIGKNDNGQRLDKFIEKAVSTLPKTLMYKYIRIKRIKVNNKRTEISYKLKQDDKVELYINDEFFVVNKEKPFLIAPTNLKIIFEDENILIVDKPAGLVVHEDERQTADTLILRIQHYLFDKGEYNPDKENSFAPSLCNRIDRNTAGLVIAAKNAETLRILNEKIKAREIKKFYLCVVHGYLEKKSTTLEAYLERDLKEKKVYIHEICQKGDVTVKTKYNVLCEKNNLSLLEVELLTGRTHQIRAHLAFVGHPLLGDGKYGSNMQNQGFIMKYQALYSYKLIFDFKTDAGILNYLNDKKIEIENVWFKEEFQKKYPFEQTKN